MPDMQELAPEKDPASHCTARIFDLRSGQELHLLPSEFLMQTTQPSGSKDSRSADSVEQTTVLILELKHRGPLPEGFEKQVANRAYDFLSAKGIRMGETEAKYFSVQKLEVRG